MLRVNVARSGASRLASADYCGVFTLSTMQVSPEPSRRKLSALQVNKGDAVCVVNVKIEKIGLTAHSRPVSLHKSAKGPELRLANSYSYAKSKYICQRAFFRSLFCVGEACEAVSHMHCNFVLAIVLASFRSFSALKLL